MTATVQRHGRYTLFETTRETRILALGDDLWFAWVRGEQGEILVRSDSEHERQRTVQQGEYYLVDFENDAAFTDVPHLFLERDGEFQEIILPNGLPSDDDTRKLVVETGKSVDRKELEGHLEAIATSEHGETIAPGDRELPIPDFDELSIRGAKPRLDALTADQLRRLRDYEAEHKRRKTLIHEIERRLR